MWNLYSTKKEKKEIRFQYTVAVQWPCEIEKQTCPEVVLLTHVPLASQTRLVS